MATIAEMYKNNIREKIADYFGLFFHDFHRGYQIADDVLMYAARDEFSPKTIAVRVKEHSGMSMEDCMKTVEDFLQSDESIVSELFTYHVYRLAR